MNGRILVKDKEYGWCLRMICAESNAQETLKYCQEREPDKEFKIEIETATEGEANWMTMGGLD